jgi:hypothetical protein
MNRALKIGIAGLLVVSVLAVGMAGTVLAQDDGAPSDSKPYAFGDWGRGHGGGLWGEVGLEAAADVLGMDVEDLSNQLWAGETLADIADEAGVDLQDVRDAVEAAFEQDKRDAIEQAVEDGLMSRDEADWLLEGLDNGYLGGFGFGHPGPGRGRFMR